MERGKGESVNTEYGEMKNKGVGDGGREGEESSREREQEEGKGS